MANETHEIEDRIAEKLISRGFAEPVKAPKVKASTKTNRAVKKVSTPEDE